MWTQGILCVCRAPVSVVARRRSLDSMAATSQDEVRSITMPLPGMTVAASSGDPVGAEGLGQQLVRETKPDDIACTRDNHDGRGATISLGNR